jgi:hypothetical protein
MGQQQSATDDSEEYMGHEKSAVATLACGGCAGGRDDNDEEDGKAGGSSISRLLRKGKEKARSNSVILQELQAVEQASHQLAEEGEGSARNADCAEEMPVFKPKPKFQRKRRRCSFVASCILWSAVQP